jgi:Ras GTPase-activating-like protein IQGAP2/3
MALGRSDSIKPVAGIGLGRSDSVKRSSFRHSTAHLTAPDLDSLQKSSTGHLRTLSRIAGNDASQDFAIKTPEQEVVGLHGRRRLQCADRSRIGKGTAGSTRTTYGWERNWMDKQRQFLQAYEYLCHIGEAKEWIENVIDKEIPPIVQLEEALRNGVTLAEIVQSIQPNQPIRIFQHPKLQYRHSDNIAIFFRFLAEMELPELFRFEFVDLYEKKNIPKVIYCIHALSWLLFRKGIIDFRIGNLVGQLEFEHHELEEMQKGLDKAGVSMPSFSGMGASFGAEPEPEPEPEPVETEQERVERELAEHEDVTMDLQSQIRGAVVRLRLGQDMQGLWAAEARLIDLQSRLRGNWARQIFDYRLQMRTFAVQLQGATRGFLVRSRRQDDEQRWRRQQGQIVMLQSLVRSRKARENVQLLRSQLRREEHGVKSIQAAIKGALQRRKYDEQSRQVQHTSTAVTNLQAACRGQLMRSRMASDRGRLTGHVHGVKSLQSAARGAILRKQQADTIRSLQAKAGVWRALQAIARGRRARLSVTATQTKLHAELSQIRRLQATIRGAEVRTEVVATKAALALHEKEATTLQAKARAMLLRRRLSRQAESLRANSSSIVGFQGVARGHLLRAHQTRLLSDLRSHAAEVTTLQGLGRAMVLRSSIGDLLAQLDSEEESIVELQAFAQGMLVRARYVEKQRYFKQNMQKVIKLQSFVRGRLQGEAYKSLTSGKNPPVGTLKGFVHLLNDSDFDFDEEIGRCAPGMEW